MLSKNKLKIFILDDDKNSNYLNCLILNLAGISDIVIRTSAFDAFQYLEECVRKNTYPDLMFIDLELPGMNGFGFLSKYESEYMRYCPQSKIIMLTNSVNDEDRRTARQHKSVVDFKSKPLSISKFNDILSSMASDSSIAKA